jgi:hypothetical protein
VAAIRTREWAETDYYEVLGLTPDAPAAEIDARYRSLAKAHHPDRTDDPADTERFKDVVAAYRVLREPSVRAAYDEFRHRVAEGRLPSPPAPERGGPVDHFAPPRRPRRRAPMPAWARSAIAGTLVTVGVIVALVAVFGDLPAPTAADTPTAVRVTLLIAAVKLWACGAIVATYPALRARWHR